MIFDTQEIPNELPRRWKYLKAIRENNVVEAELIKQEVEYARERV